MSYKTNHNWDYSAIPRKATIWNSEALAFPQGRAQKFAGDSVSITARGLVVSVPEQDVEISHGELS